MSSLCHLFADTVSFSPESSLLFSHSLHPYKPCSWVRKIPWRRERLPTPVFWPGEFHGLYSPWGSKELDMAKWLSGEGNGTPLPYSCLENPKDGGAWQAAVHGIARVGHDWATSLSLFTFMHWRRKWQPTPVFLPGESQGWGSLVGCRLWGRTESCPSSSKSFSLSLSLSWYIIGFPGGASSKESTYQHRSWLIRDAVSINPWVRKIPWRRPWQPSSVFLPGESHGQRSLVGYSP